ncbi:hypothetical protein KL933_000678 [Ogataea haglerorum]|uniref:Protein SCD5 n=1 Tax=Ogataea haglerorum TaxID=1937702 RepID=A0AAN6I3K1_9ASCO|nr:hypothetical protein KL915_000662 [Ogataea haglerorum]KAG7701631.1 hypothetical protein KL951_000087 [Ogataea haglerorum]KAG7711445.1 hypothetical protein KL914_000087 [Ogataea haglerorum]KAG7730883.1 hypothetical protein KL933_000678 [Ogataea haglerorum]KAG7734521.1 hypothetical protein KL948_000087 [Ogataea haglerorum]
MSQGFDWFSMPGMNADTEHTERLTHPSVSFGFSSAPSGSSVPTAQAQQQVHSSPYKNRSAHLNASADTLFEPDKMSDIFNRLDISGRDRRAQSDDNISLGYTPTNMAGTESGNKRDPHPLAKSTESLASDDDSTVALSLTANDLSIQEAKTYLRWYNNILSRKRGERTITLEEVFRFLSNFRISEAIKSKLRELFGKIAYSLNIGQFYALLRLLAHTLEGKPLRKSLIKVQASIPKPISIMARKRAKDPNESIDSSETSSIDEQLTEASQEPPQKLDLDSFTQFILTGERPSKSPKKKSRSGKKVKFSDQVIIEPPPSDDTSISSTDTPPEKSSFDFSLPMDQLLARMKNETSSPSLQQGPPANTEDEEEELKDMQESINHFQNVTIDSVSIHGTPSSVPTLQVNDGSPDAMSAPLQPLTPNLTGSVSKSMRNHYNLPPPRERGNSSPLPFSSQPRVSSPLTRNGTTSADSATTFLEAALSQGPGSPGPEHSHATPPPPPPSRNRGSSLLRPPPPPPRSRKNSSPPPVLAPEGPTQEQPSLPPKPFLTDMQRQHHLSAENMTPNFTGGFGQGSDLLNSLKSLQAEVDRIKANEY